MPWYLWEVKPVDAGTIAEADKPETTFEAKLPGKAVFQLTARDGLYQVISECSTEVIAFANISVTLEATPNEPAVGDTVTLTCSTGAVVPSGTRAIELIGAGDGQLTSVAEGVATFTAGSPGALTFRCVASSADGERVTSPNLTVTVAPSADGDGQLENVGGGSDAGDGAGGTDGNDNSDTNEGGGNGGGPSPRPPVRR